MAQREAGHAVSGLFDPGRGLLITLLRVVRTRDTYRWAQDWQRHQDFIACLFGPAQVSQDKHSKAGLARAVLDRSKSREISRAVWRRAVNRMADKCRRPVGKPVLLRLPHAHTKA